jgi:hypothetical protein
MKPPSRDPPAPTKAPLHLWLVAGVTALLFGVGGYDHVMTLTHNAAYFEYLGYGDRRIAYFTDYPLPLAALWTIGVWGAVAGSVLLLARSRWAVGAFGAALLGQASLDAATFLFKRRWEVLGARLSAQDLAILALTLGVLLYARSLRDRRVLR